MTALVLQALSLCKLVHSFTWADDSFGAPTSLPTSLFCSQLLPYSPLSSDSISAHLHHLPTTPPDIGTHHTTGPTFGSNAHGETLFSVLLRAILGRLPWQDQAEHERPGLRSLTLKTYADLGSETWTMLESVASLRKVAIWSMSGPPRVLERWCTTLSPTLTQVELGVRCFLYRCMATRLTNQNCVSFTPRNVQVSQQERCSLSSHSCLCCDNSDLRARSRLLSPSLSHICLYWNYSTLSTSHLHRLPRRTLIYTEYLHRYWKHGRNFRN